MWIFDRHRHLSHDRLSEYVGNRVSQEEKARIDGAAAECALCRKELESLGETRLLLQSLPQLEPSRSFVMAGAPVAAAAGVALAPARPLFFRAPSWAYAGAASLAGLAIALVLVTDGGGLWSRQGGESFTESITMASQAAGVAPVTAVASLPPAGVAEEAQAVPIPASAPAMPMAQAAPAQEMAETAVLKEVPAVKEAEIQAEIEAKPAMSASAIVSVAPTEPTSLPASKAAPEPETAESPAALPSIGIESSAEGEMEALSQSASDTEETAMAKAEPTGLMGPATLTGEANPQGGMGSQGLAGGDGAPGPSGPPGPAGEAGPQGSAVLPEPAKGYASGSSNAPESDAVGGQTVVSGGSTEASPADVPSPTEVPGTGYADRETSPTATGQKDYAETETVAESVLAGGSLPDPTQETTGSASVVGESEGPKGRPSSDALPQAEPQIGEMPQEVPPIAMAGVASDDTSAFATSNELAGKEEVQATVEAAPGAVTDSSAALEIEATSRDRLVSSRAEEPEAKKVEQAAIERDNSLKKESPRGFSESGSAADDRPEESWLEARWVAIATVVAIVIVLAIASAYRFLGASKSTR